MPECERLPGCPFFNDCSDSEKSVYLEEMKKRYCLGDNSACARYMVFIELGPGATPDDLLPDQIDEARKFIEKLM